MKEKNVHIGSLLAFNAKKNISKVLIVIINKNESCIIYHYIFDIYIYGHTSTNTTIP